MSFLKLCVAGTFVGVLVGAPTSAAGEDRTVFHAAAGANWLGKTSTDGSRLFLRAPSPAPRQTQSVSIVAEPPKKYAVSVEWGLDNAFTGKMIKEASGQTTGGVPIHLDETTYDETYGRLSQFKAGLVVRTASRAEAMVNFIYSRSGAETVDIGTVSQAGLPVTVDFSSLDYWGFEGGQRFFFSRAILQPFGGYLVGANRYDDVTAVFEGGDANLLPGLAAQDGKVFEKSWAFSAGPTGGVLVDLGGVALMAELQLRYMGGLSDVDWLVEEGLRDINDESSRWSLPLSMGVRFKF
jgi:hypothetical protein